jgi:hypothetical protein
LKTKIASLNKKISTSLFVDSVSTNKRKIYLEVRNAVMEFDCVSFRKALSHQLVNSYTLTDNPEKPQYRMSVLSET